MYIFNDDENNNSDNNNLGYKMDGVVFSTLLVTVVHQK